METALGVLSEQECSRIHEESLKILWETGIRVDTEKGRNYLKQGGASVNEDKNLVHIPAGLVEESLKVAPKKFSLSGRRLERKIALGEGECAVVMDGGAVYTYDTEVKVRRPATLDDWYLATQLGDCMDEIDVYWSAVEGCWGNSAGDTVAYWKAVFQNFSKHIQDATASPEQSRWMLEVLQVIFGSREEFRKTYPMSFLLCPASPLMIEAEYTDAYLETLDWGIPVAVMTMPMYGLSAPASLISELMLANCETLAMLCLVQSAAPGTPFIYAAIPVVADMRTGRYGSGEIENSLFGAAVTEMARFYQLPVEASAGGSDHSIPGIQSAYERALNFSLPILAKPDLLVAPGLLGGSTIFSPEQLMIDLEVIRRCKRLSQGIGSGTEKWLRDVIDTVGSGGNYLSQRSTRKAARSGEIYYSNMGIHCTYDQWMHSGSPDMLASIREEIKTRLSDRKPWPLPDEVEKELNLLEKKARLSE